MSAVVARIGKPHGLRGEVTVRLHTDVPEERFVPGAEFETDPDVGVLTVESTRVHQGVWLVKFEEIPDRTAAEQMRGTEVVLADDENEDDDAWYEEDLVDVEVRDPEGSRIGVVAGLQVRPVQDLLEIKLDDGRIGLVPFVEALVPLMALDDLADPHIVVDAPPGLFDLES